METLKTYYFNDYGYGGFCFKQCDILFKLGYNTKSDSYDQNFINNILEYDLDKLNEELSNNNIQRIEVSTFLYDSTRLTEEEAKQAIICREYDGIENLELSKSHLLNYLIEKKKFRDIEELYYFNDNFKDIIIRIN